MRNHGFTEEQRSPADRPVLRRDPVAHQPPKPPQAGLTGPSVSSLNQYSI
jgi:hypothetical protein